MVESQVNQPNGHAVLFADRRPIFAVLADQKRWPAFLARALATEGARISQVESLSQLHELLQQPLPVCLYLGDDTTALADLLEFIRCAATHQQKSFLMVATSNPHTRSIATEAGAQAVIGSLEEAHHHLRQVRRFFGNHQIHLKEM